MASRPELLRIALQIVVYIALFFATAYLFGTLLKFLGGYLIGIFITGLFAALAANALCMRIYRQCGIAGIGLLRGRASCINLALGLCGGIGAATLVLAGPLLMHVARLQPDPANPASLGSFVFVSALLFFGSAGEEILFRGFAFQILIRGIGAWPAIVGVGVVFAALHAGNPHASALGLLNTAGFGILFGYAVLRSRDLWLPIGLHFGWNFTLPLFGVNVSGLTMRLTGVDMRWSAGTLWSGGGYGPEAGILASFVLFLLFLYLWKVPVRRQPSALLDPPQGDPLCEPGQPVSPS